MWPISIWEFLLYIPFILVFFGSIYILFIQHKIFSYQIYNVLYHLHHELNLLTHFIAIIYLYEHNNGEIKVSCQEGCDVSMYVVCIEVLLQCFLWVCSFLLSKNYVAWCVSLCCCLYYLFCFININNCYLLYIHINIHMGNSKWSIQAPLPTTSYHRSNEFDIDPNETHRWIEIKKAF